MGVLMDENETSERDTWSSFDDDVVTTSYFFEAWPASSTLVHTHMGQFCSARGATDNPRRDDANGKGAAASEEILERIRRWKLNKLKESRRNEDLDGAHEAWCATVYREIARLMNASLVHLILAYDGRVGRLLDGYQPIHCSDESWAGAM
jgi:hypothetical protein